MYKIRASALPSHADCPRRSIAKLFPEVVEGAGFKLNRTLPSVAASVGTAVHVAIAHLLRQKLAGQTYTPKDAVDAGIEGFVKETADGATWDATTQSLGVAALQISKCTAVFTEQILPAIKPKAIEQEYQAAINDDCTLSGHIDCVTEEGTVIDWKTGARPRPYTAQLGGYSLLGKSNGINVSGGEVVFIKRAAKSKPQPDPIRQVYDLVEAERAAYSVIQQMQRELKEFQETGNAWVIPANNMSMLCSAKYCPANGAGGYCTIGNKNDDD